MEENLGFPLFDSIEDGIIVSDNLGKIILINKYAEKLLGYQREELIGSLIEVLVPDRFTKIHKEHKQNYFQHPQIREMGHGRELYAKRKDGSEFLVEIGLSPVTIDDVHCVCATMRDISERVKTRKRFKDLLDLFLDAVILMDEQGNIQEVNAQAEHLFGYQYDEVISKKIELLVPEKFPEDYQNVIKDLFVKNQKKIMGTDMILHGKRKDGSQFPTEITLNPLEMEQETLIAAIVRDITSRKQFERQLFESEQRFHSLVDVAIDSILTVDDQGLILFYNNASETIFGYSRQYILGKSIHVLLSDLNNHDILNALKFPDQAENKKFFEKYHNILCKRENGEIFPAEVSIGRISFEGKPVFTWILRDITDRQRLIKMKSEFISTVSHELRTPLTSINGAIGLILMGKGGKISPEMRTFVEIAHRNSERLVLLVNDILDVEKIEADKMAFNMETVDLVKVLKNIMENDRVYADSFQVSLAYDCPYKSLMLKTDTQRLTQVITNLLSNAIKFSSPKETVTLKVEQQKNKVRISIIDHGPGIPKAFQPKLFQKFVQLDSSDNRKRGGTGLGLAIAKMITQKLGGTIGFKSQEGKGSTFYIELDTGPSARG
ncbi:MAG: PAS domain-containing sensor histidine kinase [Parachlamydiaceae bacterium]